MDLNKLGIYLGLLAIVLAVPLSILGNILTPRIVRWFSTTNLNRVLKRIHELEKELSGDDNWMFSPGEYMLFRLLAYGLRMIGYAVYVLGITLAGLTILNTKGLLHLISKQSGPTYTGPFPRTFWILLGVCTALSTVGLLLSSRANWWFRDLRQTKTPFGRKEMQNELDKLRKRLGEAS